MIQAIVFLPLIGAGLASRFSRRAWIGLRWSCLLGVQRLDRRQCHRQQDRDEETFCHDLYLRLRATVDQWPDNVLTYPTAGLL